MAKSLSREQLLDAIISVFREYGFEGASLSILSERTGLGRSSLYHHFPQGKDDMAQAALDHVLTTFTDRVLEPLSSTADTPEARLQRSCAGLREFYADGDRACLINIFSLGRAAELFQSKLAGSVAALSDLYAENARLAGVPSALAQSRGRQAVIQIQGALVVSRALQDQTPFLDVVNALPEQLLLTV